MKLLGTVTLGVLITSAAPSAFAQQSLKPTAKLIVHHYTSKTVVVMDGKQTKRDGAKLEPQMRFGIRPGTSVTIVVADPNPLLYVYKWSGVAVTPTSNLDEISKMAQQLANFSSGFGKLPKPAGVADLAMAETAASDTASALLSTKNAIAILGEQTQASHNNVMSLQKTKPNSAEMKGAAASLQSLNQQLDAALARFEKAFEQNQRAQAELSRAVALKAAAVSLRSEGIDEDLFDALATSQGELLKMAEAAPRIIQLSSDDAAGAKAKASAELAGLDAAEAGLKRSYEKLNRGAQKILAHLNDSSVAKDPLLAAVTLALHYETETNNTIKALKAFRSDAAKIGNELELGEVPFVDEQISTAAFEIVARSDAKDARQSERGSGKFTAEISPLSSVHYSVAPAYIYAWIKGDAEASGDQIAAMLRIAPRRWLENGFGGAFHIGVTPSSEGLSVMAGFSIKLAGVAEVGLGAIYKDVAKDGRTYRPGGYLLLSVSLPK